MVNYNYLLKSKSNRDLKLNKLIVKKKNLEKLVISLKNELYFNSYNNELLKNEIEYCKEEIQVWQRSLNNVINEINIVNNMNNAISRSILIKEELIDNCNKIILHPNRLNRLIISGEYDYEKDNFLSFYGW